MTIQRIDNEIIIRLPGNINTEGVQRLIDFLIYKEATVDSKATQDQVDELSSTINKNWWEQNKVRFLK
ncbi:MAG: hypothetical protein MI974_11305 [Chitinophagales bacterium]|nr:hypothetical protein [Chitinophagales bacterium]